MTHEMRSADVGAAAHALLAWCETQDMTPQDAARVLTTALVAVIHEVAMSSGRRPKEGGRIIADMIVEALP